MGLWIKKRSIYHSKITLFILLLVSFIFIPCSFATQTFWISFTDKSHNRYSLSKPDEFLSQKSLERRKHQGITLTEDDLPISELYITELKSIGCDVVSKLKWFNAIVVKTDDNFSPLEFHSLSFIKEIKNWTQRPDRIKKQPDKFDLERQLKNLSSSPRLPYPKPMSGNKYDYGKAEKQIAMMNGHFLHNNGFDGKNVIIALLDGGYDQANKNGIFDSTFKTGRYVGCRDFVLPGDTKTIWTGASSYHGTGYSPQWEEINPAKWLVQLLKLSIGFCELKTTKPKRSLRKPTGLKLPSLLIVLELMSSIHHWDTPNSMTHQKVMFTKKI